MVPVKNCTGCTACVQSCPAKCIQMVADAEGFLYPHLIEPDLCWHCNKCEQVCPLNSLPDTCLPQSAYGCYLCDKDSILKSTSGGAFFAMAKRVIHENGIVYGALLGKDLVVRHTRACNMTQLETLRKSKYVQSILDDIFALVRTDLESQRFVLFSGTPCQVAGLNAFLGKGYENLLTVQVFCAEVLSPLAWHKYISELEKTYQNNIVYYEYKTKLDYKDFLLSPYDPWRNPQILIETADGCKHILERPKDAFINAWANHLISRKCCADCQFKFKEVSKYPADLSIGDFWGCENNAPECFCELGTSAVVAHSKKGDSFFRSLDNDLKTFKVDIAAVLKGNPNISTSIKPHPKHMELFEGLISEQDSFENLVRKCLGYGGNISKLSTKIGLLGSYNTRTAIADICANSHCQLMFQYSNSSLISIVAPPVELPDNTTLPANPFRAQMLQSDFNTQLFFQLNSCEQTMPECLIIDFLEERFDLQRVSDSYITLSDANKDANYTFPSEMIRISPTFDLWKASCQKFLDCLKRRRDIKNIILIKSFLNEEYGTTEQRTAFPNLSWIKKTNDRLSDYYDFFQMYAPGVITIEIKDPSLLYCDLAHKHGCHPWHMNAVYQKKLSSDICKVISKIAIK